MSTRVITALTACLYLMAPSELHAENMFAQVLMIPEAGELVPNPTFFVVAKGYLLSKGVDLSDGDLYLLPLESNEGLKGQPVPLTITKRYRLETESRISLELRPSEALIVGASYKLQAKADTSADFVYMTHEKKVEKVWKVVPPTTDSASVLPFAAPSVAHYELEFFDRYIYQIRISAVLETVAADLSGFLTLGKDKEGRLLSTDASKSSWSSRTSLMFVVEKCFLDDLRWTHLRNVEVIPLGKRGERGDAITIPVRVNPIVTSVFGALPRIKGKNHCEGGN